MKLVATMILLLGLSGFAVPQRAGDVPADMARAEQALLAAKSELVNAGHDWGGHRVTAIKHVDAALAEVERAKQWARQHREMK